ncbi:MAG TPA: hypothetical protein VGQ92_18085, partial [Actinoplanes sp.]|nr:hypothetical protein [Actinoplanes sp.]
AAGGAAEAVPGEPVAASAAAGPGEPAAVSPADAVPGPSAAPTAARPEAPRPTPEAIDLVEAAGIPILKRVLPAVSAVIVLVLLWRILRRIRS